MVMIVIETWYPVKVSPLVGQKYLEMMQKPTDKSLGEMVLPPIFQQTKEGIHTISVWGMQGRQNQGWHDGVSEADARVCGNKGIPLSDGHYIDATEAYAIIGMKGPQ
jgi:hypothetical protein